MKRLVLMTLLLMAGAISLSASPEGAARELKGYEKYQKAWTSLLELTTDPAEKAEFLRENPKPNPSVYAGRLYGEIKRDLRKKWTVPYMKWIFANCPKFSLKKVNYMRTNFAKYHIRSAGAGAVVMSLTNFPDRRSLEIAEAVLAKNPDTKEQGQAALAIAQMLRGLADDPRVKERRLKMLRKAIIFSADQPAGDRTVGDVVKDELFYLQHLEKGGTAPEIEASSVSNQAIKLSSYKGKVVVVAFWAAPVKGSAETVQSLRELNAKMEGRDFVMIGVSTDSKKLLRKLVVDGELTWENISDEKGEIMKSYRITSLPSCFILDEKGKIAYRGTPNSFLGLTVEGLLNDMEKKKKVQP